MSKIYCTKKARTGLRLPKVTPVVEIAENRKRAFVRVSDTIIKVKRGGRK